MPALLRVYVQRRRIGAVRVGGGKSLRESWEGRWAGERGTRCSRGNDLRKTLLASTPKAQAGQMEARRSLSTNSIWGGLPLQLLRTNARETEGRVFGGVAGR